MNCSTKTIFIGPTNVGKSTIFARLSKKDLDPKAMSTIGCAFGSIYLSGHKYNLWDTAGQERYKSICKMYFRGANLILFVFDVSDLRSIEILGDFIELFFNEHTSDPEPIKYLFIGNKMDRDHPSEKFITQQLINNLYVRKYHLESTPILFLSALDNTGISDLEEKMVQFAHPGSKGDVKAPIIMNPLPEQILLPTTLSLDGPIDLNPKPESYCNYC